MTKDGPLSAEERKAQIVAKATCLFAKKGFDGTTSAALARACGVSEALIYKLFASKQGLYAAIIAHKLTTWEPLEVDLDTPDGLEAVFSRLALQVFAQVDRDPDFIRLLYYSELQESEVARQFQEARAPGALKSLGDYLRRRMERGELRADLDPSLVAAQFFTLCWHYAIGAKVWQKAVVYPQASDEVVVGTIAGLFAKGLRA